MSAQYQVERSALSFVHSDQMTRAWVTRPATTGAWVLAGASMAVIAPLRRGIRRCPE